MIEKLHQTENPSTNKCARARSLWQWASCQETDWLTIEMIVSAVGLTMERFTSQSQSAGGCDVHYVSFVRSSNRPPTHPARRRSLGIPGKGNDCQLDSNEHVAWPASQPACLEEGSHSIFELNGASEYESAAGRQRQAGGQN